MTRIPGENLVEDIQFILGGAPARVIDVGCHHGDTAQRYLILFPTVGFGVLRPKRQISPARKLRWRNMATGCVSFAMP